MSSPSRITGQDTVLQLLGLSAYDEIDLSAKQKEEDYFNLDMGNPAIRAVSRVLRLAEQRGDVIDDYFNHEHFLYGCDGLGAYCIASSFTMKARPRPRVSAITMAVIRCHDNFRDSLFIPTRADLCSSLFAQFLEDRKNEVGQDFRRAPYKLCSKLIMDCLQRMKRSNKVLQGKEARMVARLFGLPTRDVFHKVVPKLPPPSPAPSIESLWITLSRPEYYYFTVNEDLYNNHKEDSGSMVIDTKTLSKSMRLISKDEYRRNRLYAMLEHMALWHTVDGEEEVASWLLWERAAMMDYDDVDSAIEKMESNIIFQLMINKFFKPGTGSRLVPRFDNLMEYGKGLTNYMLYQADLEERGTIPPSIIITASIAENVVVSGGSSSDNGSSNHDDHNKSECSISRLSKDLTKRLGCCALCGATKAKGNGPLFRCARCASVYYCCKEHQKLHWKQGRHKQECMP